MRSNVIALFMVLMTAAVATYAAAPTTINYQGRLTDGSDSPIADGAYLINFSIYDGPAGGATELWNSGFQNIAVSDGLFSYALGSDVAFPEGLFDDSVRYLGITVGVDPELSPRTQLISVPYALGGPFVHIDGDVMSGALGIENDSTGQVVILDPSVTGDFAANLPPNSITLSEIDSTQMPRIDQKRFTGTFGTTSSSYTALADFDVSWAEDGYLFIQVTGQCYLDLDAPSSSSVTSGAVITLCTLPSDGDSCGNTEQPIYFQDADNNSVSNETKFFVLSTVVPVVGSGTDTYYINAYSFAGYNFRIYGDIRITVMYFPLSGGLITASPISNDNATPQAE